MSVRTFCRVTDGVVVDRALFDAEPPEDFPAREEWIEDEAAQIGWTFDGEVFAPPQSVLPPISVADVKAEAARRIEAIMPDYKQRNVMAWGLETIMAYGPNPANWPTELQAVNNQAQAAWAAIKAIRVRSDEIEAMSPIPADFRDDGWWG